MEYSVQPRRRGLAIYFSAPTILRSGSAGPESKHRAERKRPQVLTGAAKGAQGAPQPSSPALSQGRDRWGPTSTGGYGCADGHQGPCSPGLQGGELVGAGGGGRLPSQAGREGCGLETSILPFLRSWPFSMANSGLQLQPPGEPLPLSPGLVPKAM